MARQRLLAEPNGLRNPNINCWNEWTEGSYLEPDTVHGFQYLDAVKKVFGNSNSRLEPNPSSTNSGLYQGRAIAFAAILLRQLKLSLFYDRPFNGLQKIRSEEETVVSHLSHLDFFPDLGSKDKDWEKIRFPTKPRADLNSDQRLLSHLPMVIPEIF